MLEKVNIDLTGVPQTLLLPLLGRAECSQAAYSPLKDPRAVEIVNMLNYDFKTLRAMVGKTPKLWWLARAHHFDEAIKTYLQKHPNATIVNLGAGLETAFYRVDNGHCNWIDLDLPEVIQLRHKLIPGNARVKTIAKSVLDYSWMDEVQAYGKEIFFFAGGFFLYFPEEEVRKLFLTMLEKFPHAEVIFDTIAKKTLNYGNKMLSKAQMKGAVLKWGIDDPHEMESWSPHIAVKRIPYFSALKNNAKFPLLIRARMYYADFFDKSCVLHTTFI